MSWTNVIVILLSCEPVLYTTIFVSSDSRVTKYLTWNPHSNIEETKNIITRWISDANNSTELTFAIEYNENNEVIGSINCFKVDLTFKQAEIGYCLAYDYFNHGIMTEALIGFVRFCFEIGRLPTINIRFYGEFHPFFFMEFFFNRSSACCT